MLVVLWTDALVFILVATLVVLTIISVRKPHMRAQWRKTYSQPLRMIAMIVLLCFTIIGLLDSIHFRSRIQDNAATQPVYSTKVRSVLDVIMSPTSEQMETSYSPPFATELFGKNMMKDATGKIVWESTKLQYVSGAKILPLIILGVIYGLIGWLVVVTLLWAVFIKFYRCSFTKDSPWRVGLYTFFVISVCAGICMTLMPQYHIFGTDKVGTDIFYASVKSIRTGLIIGTLTTFITLPFAILFGALAGYFRGWVDDVIQYLYTTLSSVPAVLLIAAAVLTVDAALQRHEGALELMAQRTDVRLLLLCCVLGLTSWTSLCRFIRGETLKMREEAFILASRALGLNSMQIIIKHIVPNLMHLILISIVLDFSGLVLAEAVLSYVGVGVDPSMFSWGNMINSARMEMGREPIIWWTLAGAFVLMFTLVLAANIFADGVRDAFDPKAN